MKYLKQYTVALLFFLGGHLLVAQDYPIPLRPGQSMRIHAGNDTLWVIKDSQMKTALKSAETVNLAEQEVALLKNKSDSLNAIIAEKDQQNARLEEGYDRYRKKWEASDKSLEAAEIKINKLRRQRTIFGISGVVVGLITMFIIK